MLAKSLFLAFHFNLANIVTAVIRPRFPAPFWTWDSPLCFPLPFHNSCQSLLDLSVLVILRTLEINVLSCVDIYFVQTRKAGGPSTKISSSAQRSSWNFCEETYQHNTFAIGKHFRFLANTVAFGKHSLNLRVTHAPVERCPGSPREPAL